jgi:uncharacterized protein (DUF305 family)
MPLQVFATPRRRALTLGALAVVISLLLGYAAGLLTPSLRGPGNDSAEAGFARDMSTHHAQAVDMGMIAFQKAADPDVRELGYDIALTQENQIGIMQTWLKNWHLGPTGDQPKMAWMPNGAEALGADGLMPGMATEAELIQLRQATGKQVDIEFCQLMIRHHLGGIHMVSEILTLTKDQQVRDLATAMKNGQQNEVTILKNKLTQLGAQPLGS